MNDLSQLWPDLIYTALGIGFINGAITGNFYTARRGGGRNLIASIRSTPIRLLILVLAVSLLVWTVCDVRRKLYSGDRSRAETGRCADGPLHTFLSLSSDRYDDVVRQGACYSGFFARAAARELEDEELSK